MKSFKDLLNEKTNKNWYHPGKSSQLRIGRSIIANYGEIHPLILQKYEIQNAVFGFEIYIDQTAQFNSKKLSTKNAYNDNSLQAIERDFSFFFSKNVKGADIIQTVKKIDKTNPMYSRICQNKLQPIIISKNEYNNLKKKKNKSIESKRREYLS